jgi:putative membrane protein
MKFTIAAATLSLLMASSAAYAQSAAETTGINSLAGVAPKTEDFVQEAAASDMFEIESSKLAVERGDEPTKAFARQMITEHEKTSTELKKMVGDLQLKAPPANTMSSAQQGMLDELKSLQGADFNKEYHDDQVTAHENAVDLFKRYGEEGDKPELKAWAAKTLPALQHHLQMAQELDK